MIKDIIFTPDQIGNVPSVKEELAKRLGSSEFTIEKSFIDARHKNDIKVVYRVSKGEERSDDTAAALPHLGKRFNISKRPVIVGFGPAGMFCGLVLARYGLNPIIIEKGRPVEERTKDVSFYKEKGVIDPSSNIQFGEGGAGTFSDGKLYTGVSSGLKGFIGQVMVRYGAPEDILYDSHPHVGTDNLVNVVKGIRKEIISLGGEIRFSEELVRIVPGHDGSSVSEVITDKGSYLTDTLILAIGNSSRDLIRNNASFLKVESKPFAVGVRIEHLRSDIDKAMYGFDTADYKNICAANYKLAVDTCSGKKLYTFCMCPGGEVVPSASFEKAVVTNGMSYRARNNDNSNSALLVPFDPKEVSDDPLAGITFQDMLETKAYTLAGSDSTAPFMTYGDLKAGKSGTSYSSVVPTYKPGVTACDLRELLPEVFVETLKDGISLMGRKIRGFDSENAVLTAVETRSSSPVRIPRNRDTFESVACKGIFPIGEGAGYAGGIMSSAIDGIKCGNLIAESMLL
ncbi:MAG: hypothetical protein J5883_08535 [Clostridiales bacterium]|nr:hypothetical protein [Clostridiales bacterium]